MALLFLLGAHLLFGACMAFLTHQRLREEGELFGLPLTVTFAPITLLSAPLSTFMALTSPDWFYRGFTLLDPTTVERFHLPISIVVAAGLFVLATVGMAVSIAFFTRERMMLATAPLLAGMGVCAFALVRGGSKLVSVPGESSFFFHPLGWASSGICFGLVGAMLLAWLRVGRTVAAT